MERYFSLYPNDYKRAISHYECNLMLSEAMYVSLSVFEVTLRNALSRELEQMTGRKDWYANFSQTPGLKDLNRYVSKAIKQIAGRHEQVTPSKVVAELTLGFWVSLLNSEYEKILWKDLRRAFPFMPKAKRKRKNISAPLNRFRSFRNRVFHNESICWNLQRVCEIHAEMLGVMKWMNNDISTWLQPLDRFEQTTQVIKSKMEWR